MNLWRDIYLVGQIFGLRVIIRNQWHPFYGGADFEIFRIGTKTTFDRYSEKQEKRVEYILSLLGFQLSIRKTKANQAQE